MHHMLENTKNTDQVSAKFNSVIFFYPGECFKAYHLKFLNAFLSVQLHETMLQHITKYSFLSYFKSKRGERQTHFLFPVVCYQN